MSISKEAKRDYDAERYVKKCIAGTVPKSRKRPLGTGNLSAHRLNNHDDEHAAIIKEMRRIGLR